MQWISVSSKSSIIVSRTTLSHSYICYEAGLDASSPPTSLRAFLYYSDIVKSARTGLSALSLKKVLVLSMTLLLDLYSTAIIIIRLHLMASWVFTHPPSIFIRFVLSLDVSSAPASLIDAKSTNHAFTFLLSLFPHNLFIFLNGEPHFFSSLCLTHQKQACRCMIFLASYDLHSYLCDIFLLNSFIFEMMWHLFLHNYCFHGFLNSFYEMRKNSFMLSLSLLFCLFFTITFLIFQKELPITFDFWNF